MHGEDEKFTFYAKDLYVTRLCTGRLKALRLIPSTGKKFFSFLTHTGWLWGPPNSLLSSGYWGSPISKSKSARMWSGHRIPCSGKTKNAWSYIFTTPYAFMVWCFNKYRDHIDCLLYLYLKETGWKNLICPRCVGILWTWWWTFESRSGRTFLYRLAHCQVIEMELFEGSEYLYICAYLLHS
jgi:hypothetical protein